MLSNDTLFILNDVKIYQGFPQAGCAGAQHCWPPPPRQDVTIEIREEARTIWK